MTVLNTTKLMSLFTALFLFLAVGCAEALETESNNGGDTDTDTGTETTDGYFALPDTPGDQYESEEFNFHVQTVVDGLDQPWAAAFLPEGLVLITERDGTLRKIKNGEMHSDPVAGVPEVFARNQGGLLDIEPHPNYDENGWLYISYSKPNNGEGMTAIVRAKFDEEAHALTDMEELYVGTPFTSRGHHFGSRIVFDHDGYMYFSIGDRGEMNTAQDLSKSNGSLFRLNDNGTIPEDNPFVGREGLDEIYSYGHRNIQGMAVHPETGVVWTNEHGPRGGDEININDKPGANYGWPEITYGINYDGTTITDETHREGMEQPVHQYTPSIAPAGMAFVTSDKYPGWEGNALIGALAYQLISRVELDGDQFVREERIVEEIGRIRHVIEAPDGYIYFLNESNGTLNRILPITD